MFFMMGITDGRKDFDFHQQIICDICGKYGRFQVSMTYTVLSLFFIPCFKWNKHYYVQTSCCNTVYELDAEVGKRIAALFNATSIPLFVFIPMNGEPQLFRGAADKATYKKAIDDFLLKTE